MMLLTVLYIFIIIKFLVYVTNVRCKSKVCLVGKTALITGGNSGIGLHLCKELAARGCTIIIADKTDATSTVAKLVKETHNANISWREVDFTSFKSVRSFAENLKKDLNKLDILVNNAGTGVSTMRVTEDGFQEIMQINYFSHFLLTHLLLDLMLKSSPSRIIYTSSAAAYVANLTDNNIKGEYLRNMKPHSMGPYANSKLAGIIMTKLFAEKLKDTGVTSNAYHPGIVRTGIWACIIVNRHVLGYALWLWTILFGKDVEDGIQTVLHLACSDEAEKVSGKYFIECMSVPPPKAVKSKDYCEKIWKLSEKYVKLSPEEKIDAVIKRNAKK